MVAAVHRITTPPIGAYIDIYEKAEAGLQLHSTGFMDKVVPEPGGAVYWILREAGTGVKWPFAEADVLDWGYAAHTNARGL
ncbi:MAG: hypothetical protein HQ582_11405 [Planctomycetes bacterium]|nr:hypothetical protein [Planctomycetota bacterium]